MFLFGITDPEKKPSSPSRSQIYGTISFLAREPLCSECSYLGSVKARHTCHLRGHQHYNRKREAPYWRFVDAV